MRIIEAVVAYVVVAAMLFGDPLQPIALATLWYNRLGAPYWQGVATLGLVGSVLMMLTLRNSIGVAFRPSVFVSLAVLLPTIFVGVYADVLRHRAVVALEAEEVEEHSFFRSLHEAPRDFQFFLHTAALKDCTSYAWSYRKMAFYQLGRSVAGNVIPRSWMTKCSIPEPRNAQ